MPDDEKLNQIFQAIFGVANTEEKGMVGDIKEVKETIKSFRNDQNRLKGRVNSLIWFLAGAGVLTAGAGVGLLKLALG